MADVALGAPNTGTTATGIGGNSGSGFGFLRLHPAIQGALQLGSLAPGIAGSAVGAVNAGIRANNTMAGNNVAQGLGVPQTNPLQFLASMLGLSNQGDTQGNATIGGDVFHNPNAPAASPGSMVTQGGMYDASPFAFIARALDSVLGTGMFDPRTSSIPAEAANRGNVAGYAANPTLGAAANQPGAVYTGPIGPTLNGNPLAAAVKPKLTADQKAAQLAQAYAGTRQAGNFTSPQGISTQSGNDRAGNYTSSGEQTGNAGVVSSSGNGYNSISHT